MANNDVEIPKIYSVLIKWPLYLLTLLLPVFFLPWTSNALNFNKQSILLLLVSISLFAWIIRSLVSGSARISFNPFLTLVILFAFIYGFASFFSIYRYGSIWGIGSLITPGLITIAALCIFYFLAICIFRKKEIINMLRLFVLSSFLALFYGILQLIGKFIFKFPFAQSSNFNTIGSVNELGIFAAILFPLALMMVYSSKRVLKGLFIALIISEIIVLLLVNFKFAWLAVAVGAALIIILGTQKRDWIGGNKLVVPMFAFAVSLVLAFFNFQMPVSSSRAVEVYLNQVSSFDIVKSILVEKPILGSGPGTFIYDFAKFKKAEFNGTVFWNTSFAAAGSKIMNLFAETGVLGIFSFLLLIASFLFNGLLFALGRNNILKLDQQNLTDMPVEEADKEAWMVKIGVFASFAVLVVFYFFYNSSLTIDFFFFLLIASMSVFLYPGKKEVILKTSSMSTLVLTFALMVIFIANLGVLISGVQKYIAEVYYLDGIKSYSNGDIDLSLAKVERAISINQKSDVFSRSLAEIYLAKLNAEIKRNDIPVAQVSQNVQRLVQLSNASAQRAVLLNPFDSANWSVKGYVSLSFIPLYIGFDEEAIKAYDEAIKLEPTNPYYLTQEGIVLATAAFQLKEDQKADREKKLTDAEAKFKRAIELKPDYASAMYQLAGIYQAQGKTDEAVGELKKAEIAAPFDIGLIFQLGLVYYGTGEYDDAQFEFKKVININPQYSNALYFLGLTYNKLGDRNKAIEMMEKVSSLNPGNEEVKKVMNNLKNGRDALDGITSNASTPVVENPGEIQSSP